MQATSSASKIGSTFFTCNNINPCLVAFRLSYIVWLLHNLIQRIPAPVEIHVMYDIACTLVQHLKNSRDGGPLLDRVQFTLPSFHAYGHKASCQVNYTLIICIWHLALLIETILGVS